MRRVFRRIPGSTPWSKARRVFSAYTAVLILALAAELIVLQRSGWTVLTEEWVAWLLIGYSAVFFAVVIVGVIFLTSTEFRPNPTRLALDTMISILFCVLSFATVYRFTGITLVEDCVPTADPVDHLYFSAVTFSTLGYGDFRPCEAGRVLAAAHAIYGNLHLGLIVGSAFFFAQVMGDRDRPRSGHHGDDQRHGPDDIEH